MSEKEVHICPILMRTVIWEDGKCTEECDEDECPIEILYSQFIDSTHATQL